MFAYSFYGILAAGWSVAASRRQHRRYGALIETYRNYQHRSEYPGYYVFLFIHCKRDRVLFWVDIVEDAGEATVELCCGCYAVGRVDYADA